MNRNKRGELDLLLLRQAYLARKLQSGDTSKLVELKSVKILINQWYENENEKVKLQCRIRKSQYLPSCSTSKAYQKNFNLEARN